MSNVHRSNFNQQKFVVGFKFPYFPEVEVLQIETVYLSMRCYDVRMMVAYFSVHTLVNCGREFNTLIITFHVPGYHTKQKKSIQSVRMMPSNCTTTTCNNDVVNFFYTLNWEILWKS